MRVKRVFVPETGSLFYYSTDEDIRVSAYLRNGDYVDFPRVAAVEFQSLGVIIRRNLSTKGTAYTYDDITAIEIQEETRAS